MWIYVTLFSVVMTVSAVFFARHVIRRLEEMDGRMNADKREERIFRLYTEIESMMDSFEEYVDEVREEIEGQRAALDESLRQAQALFAQFSEMQARAALNLEKLHAAEKPPEPEDGQKRPKAQQASSKQAPAQEKPAAKQKKSRLSAKDRGELEAMTAKAQKVRFLMSRGFSLEEVARELNIGKGEVRLIADLSK